MGKSDLFRRSFEAGTAFLDMTRERAESLVKELVKAGDIGKGKAEKAIEEILERSRQSTDELRAFVRGEIIEQVSALGLATRADIARVEARLEAMGTAATEEATPPPPAPAPARKSGAGKAAATPGDTTAAGGGEAIATGAKAAAKKMAAKKSTKAPAARKIPPAAQPLAGSPGGSSDAGAGPATPTGGPPPDGSAEG